MNLEKDRNDIKIMKIGFLDQKNNARKQIRQSKERLVTQE